MTLIKWSVIKFQCTHTHHVNSSFWRDIWVRVRFTLVSIFNVIHSSLQTMARNTFEQKPSLSVTPSTKNVAMMEGMGLSAQEVFVLLLVLILSVYVIYKYFLPSLYIEKRDNVVIKIAALGRPFKIGSLYDYRRDRLFEDVCLNDPKILKHITKLDYDTSSDEVHRDTFLHRFKMLGLGYFQKFSFLSGTLYPNFGSSKHLQADINDNTFVLRHEYKSHSLSLNEELIPSQSLLPITKWCKDATHIVTRIDYGAISFCLFEEDSCQTFQDEEGEKKIVESLVIKYQSTKPFEGNKLVFTPYSDYSFPNSPEMVTRCQDLKALNEHLHKSVSNKPLTIHLMRLPGVKPEYQLDDDIEEKLNTIADIVENVDSVIVKCTNLSKATVDEFTLSQLSKFQDMLIAYKRYVQNLAFSIIDQLNGDNDAKKTIQSNIDHLQQSPFHKQAMLACLSEINLVATNFEKAKKMLQNVRYIECEEELHHWCVNNSVTFALKLNRINTNKTLQEMERFLENANIFQFEEPGTTNQEGEPMILQLCQQFVAFHEANKQNAAVSFVWLESSECEDSKCKIIFAGENHLFANDFVIPDVQGAPEINPDSGSLLDKCLPLSWDHPEHGAENITEYEIILSNNDGEVIRFRTKTNVNHFVCADVDSSQIILAAVCPICWSAFGQMSPKINPFQTIMKRARFSVKQEHWQISPYSLQIVFKKPTIGKGRTPIPITVYDIRVQDIKRKKVSHELISDEDKNVRDRNVIYVTADVPVEPNCDYLFKINAKFGSSSISWNSDELFKIDVTQTQITKENIRIASRYIRGSAPKIYELKMKKIFSDEKCRLRWLELGNSHHQKDNKIIMVVGATGAGKTTLINGLINYILGVEWHDKFRFILINEATTAQNQAVSQTRDITAYTINYQEGFKVPYTLTIVDTPGFGDTGGILRDKEITSQIRTYFTASDGGGIDSINCICFVAQSSLPRLTVTQRYIFDQILALFGKDIGRNIYMMLTFADAQEPQVLSGIEEAEMPHQGYYKFNNSALYTKVVPKKPFERRSQNEESEKFDAMFWRMGMDSFERFATKLTTMESVSLVLTKEVLNEREKIQTKVTGIQTEIKVALSTLDTLDEEKRVVEQHQAEIIANENFTYTVDEIDIKQVDIPCGRHITNCLTCNRTCHEICRIANDDQKRRCASMDHKGNCTVCPGLCIWSEHRNMRYKIIVETKKVKKTYEDLRKRYEEAGEKTLSGNEVIDKLYEEFTEKQVIVMALTVEVRKSIEHLREIALRPNPMSNTEYIDKLIETEEFDHRPRWKERTAQLKKLREEAEWMHNCEKQGYDPFEKYQERIQKKSTGTRIKNALFGLGKAIKGVFQ